MERKSRRKAKAQSIGAETLGKETIDTNSYGRSDGIRGNFSTNFQLTGRELMTPDEVRLLDNRYAITFIRGERPVLDNKYELMKHPDILLSADGGGRKYTHHAETMNADCRIEIVSLSMFPGRKMDDFPLMEGYFANYVAYDDEETDVLCEFLENNKNSLTMGGKQSNERKQNDAG